MDNALITELRSLSAAAYRDHCSRTRQLARSENMHLRCLHPSRAYVSPMTSTEHELRGDGESHTRNGPPAARRSVKGRLTVDDRKSTEIASTFWDLYFDSLWWVFVAAATIGIILVAGCITSRPREIAWSSGAARPAR